MGDSPKDISDLSPAQRELLLRRLNRYLGGKRAGAEGRAAPQEAGAARVGPRAAGGEARAPERATLPGSLVELQPLGRKRPFFCVHARRGGVSSYHHLARHLGTDRPSYGLQAKGLVAGEEPHTRVEEMAAHYLRAVRAVQPEGPYAVGGWSFGGLVALEMAQQLAASGEGVALLALIDTYAHTAEGLTEMDTSGMLSEILEGTFEVGGGRFAGLRLDDDLEATWAALQAEGVVPAGLTSKWFRAYVNVSRANHEALLAYVQRPYPGRVALFQAEEGRDVSLAEQRSRWEEMTAGVDARTVPCVHNDIVNEPHVVTLAGHLREFLEATD